MAIHEGSCHCGAVKFRVEVADASREVLDCNCTICTKKGFLHLIVEDPQFTLLDGEDHLITYSFGTHVAKHMFCRTCGIQPFYKPRSHPDGWDINARCLDTALSHWHVRPFDGANWESNIELIR